MYTYINFFKKSFYSKHSKYWYLTTYNKQKLFFGNSTYRAKQLLILTLNFLIKFILFLKKITRKSDKSLRYFWLIPKSLLIIRFKNKGARMGKGKGKQLIKIQKIYHHTNFIEFYGIRLGRLNFFLFYLNLRFIQYFYLYYSQFNWSGKMIYFFI